MVVFPNIVFPFRPVGCSVDEGSVSEMGISWLGLSPCPQVSAIGVGWMG